MLLRQYEGDIVAISQPAHAWLAGVLAAAWGNDTFEVPEPRDAMICAAALHDIGWLEWERAPVLDPTTGFPLEFQNVPAEIHTKLWQRGVKHASIFGLLQALLVSRHGDAIYEHTFDMETARPEAVRAVNAFRAKQSEFQQGAISRLANNTSVADCVSDANLVFSKAFIVAVDTMSLHLGWGLSGEVTIDEVPFSSEKAAAISMRRREDGTITVCPWPFSTPVVPVSIEGKRLSRPSLDQADLDTQLEQASPSRERVNLVKS